MIDDPFEARRKNNIQFDKFVWGEQTTPLLCLTCSTVMWSGTPSIRMQFGALVSACVCEACAEYMQLQLRILNV